MFPPDLRAAVMVGLPVAGFAAALVLVASAVAGLVERCRARRARDARLARWVEEGEDW